LTVFGRNAQVGGVRDAQFRLIGAVGDAKRGDTIDRIGPIAGKAAAPVTRIAPGGKVMMK
jgi:hypothetical protein